MLQVGEQNHFFLCSFLLNSGLPSKYYCTGCELPQVSQEILQLMSMTPSLESFEWMSPFPSSCRNYLFKNCNYSLSSCTEQDAEPRRTWEISYLLQSVWMANDCLLQCMTSCAVYDILAFSPGGREGKSLWDSLYYRG